MKKFLLGVLCGVLLAGLIGVVLIFSLVKLSDSRPSVADNSALLLKLEGEIPERAPMELPLAIFENQAPATVSDIWTVLHRASADSRIKALVIAPRGMSAGWAKMQEIRNSILAFKKSGKPVYAFLRAPGFREYYVAALADKIYTGPEDFLDVKGLALEAMFFKGTLDKVGVQMEVEHIGRYKDAFDPFTRDSMTPETREVYNSLLDQIYGSVAGAIAEGRKKTPDEVRRIIDTGPFSAADAKAKGLVDILGYEDQFFNDLKNQLKVAEIKKISNRDYLRASRPEDGGARIALVVGSGAITSGSGDGGPFGDDGGIKSGSFTKLLRQVKNDSGIKGVIVRVDSPGGDAIASDDILHEMKELSQSKPMVISMSDVAASGGYFIAVTGDPILAYPDTITGSIGVITARLNAHGLYDKLGIQKEILTRGAFAAMDSDYKPLTDAERAKLRQSIESTYKGFVSRVALGRHKTYDEIDRLAQGRVWMGAQAKQNGLVDELGGMDRAVEMIRDRAKLGADAKIVLVPYPPRRSLFEVLTSKSDDSNIIEARLSRALTQFRGGDWVRASLRGGMMMLMPYHISIQ